MASSVVTKMFRLNTLEEALLAVQAGKFVVVVVSGAEK
jgi:hypothetical protein